MHRETPNFRYEQGLACPLCGAMLEKLYIQDSRGRYKRHVSVIKRAEIKGPWAKDDVLEEATESVNAYSKRIKGRQWVHTCEFMCSKCGTVLSRAQGVPHEFSDEELPYNFWDKPDGIYLPEEKPEPEPPATIDDLYGINSIF